MFACYFIATICLSSSLVAAMSPKAALTAALEAINTVDVHSFISFMASLPREVAKIFQAVIEGFRLSISEGPKAFPVLSIDSVNVADCTNATVDASAYIKAFGHPLVAALAKATSSQSLHQFAPEKITIVSASPKSADPTFGHCKDMIVMLFIVAACFYLIKMYAYLRRIASCAFKNWQIRTASSQVIMPDHIEFTNVEGIDFPTADWSRGHQELWTTYSADESFLESISSDTVKPANLTFDVLYSNGISSVSSGTSDSVTSVSSLEQQAPKKKKEERVWPSRDLLATLEADLDLFEKKINEMRREPKTGITINPRATTKEAAERIQNHVHHVYEFEDLIKESLLIMSWVQNSMKFLAPLEARCRFQNRKGQELQRRINACSRVFRTKFGFDDTGFLRSMRGSIYLIQYFNPRSWSMIRQSEVRGAYDKLRQFLSRKEELLASFLDECLDTIRECVELRNRVAQFLLEI